MFDTAKAAKYFLVRAEQDYNNDHTIAGTDITVTLNTTIEAVPFINRVGTVQSAPAGTILDQGDQVVVHHNIFRQINNLKGQMVKSDYHIWDKLYYVPPTEVFMFKKPGDEDWRAVDPYVFVEPILAEKLESQYLDLVVQDKYHQHLGIITHINQELIDNGLRVGDKIVFSRDSEHQYDLDGRTLYRMRTSDIMATVE